MKRDLLRSLAVLAAASILGLATNVLCARPVPVFSPRGPGAWPERAPRVTVEMLRSVLGSAQAPLLLDVRSRSAHGEGHPAGARNAPYERFVEEYNRPELGALLRAAPVIVVLCENADCPSADRAAMLLAELGHPKAGVLHGGWEAYRAAGLPVAR